MKRLLLVALGAGAGLVAQAQVTYLTNQHLDFRLQYDPGATGSNRLGIIVGYDPAQRVTNTQVYVAGNTNAKVTIPANPNYAFLGTAGSPVWILPQSQIGSLPYLGISAEDIPDGVLMNPMRLEVVGVEGPGNFFSWSVSGAGQPPTVKMIVTNGVVAPQFDSASVRVGSHEHNNWGFSTNGLYRVTFRAHGRFLGESTDTRGRDVAWAFQLLPLRPWEQWVSTNWPPATAGIVNGPGADPDGDGIVNLLEYAFGNDPNVALYTNAPVAALVNHEGTNYGALRYTRAIHATDVTFAVRASSSTLAGFTETLTQVSSVVTNGTLEIVTVRDAIPLAQATHRLYQLHVQLHYP